VYHSSEAGEASLELRIFFGKRGREEQDKKQAKEEKSDGVFLELP
jgi:hypothetical protein